MSLAKETIQETIKNFGATAQDTGSSQVQIAILTKKIQDLTEHFKIHKKDHHSRRGLLRMVNQRRKLLRYLKQNNLESYRKLIKELGLRN